MKPGTATDPRLEFLVTVGLVFVAIREYIPIRDFILPLRRPLLQEQGLRPVVATRAVLS